MLKNYALSGILLLGLLVLSGPAMADDADTHCAAATTETTVVAEVDLLAPEESLTGTDAHEHDVMDILEAENTPDQIEQADCYWTCHPGSDCSGYGHADYICGRTVQHTALCC